MDVTTWHQERVGVKLCGGTAVDGDPHTGRGGDLGARRRYLLLPYSGTQQRFELDGADRARAFLLDRGFSETAADVVWRAIALHTTPGIPGRMEPEVAATHYGVLTDVVGWGLGKLESDRLDEIVAAHPRRDFKKEFLRVFVDGLRDRPDTTYGTVNADILEHFVPGFRRMSMVRRIMESPWPQ
ncbi:diguanylate cyclase [Streptomyces collinus]|uniref:diguanylate cyclase n=1 Tax=Streptomyces collinus TaxID=42684 RepID=UPI0033AEEA18